MGSSSGDSLSELESDASGIFVDEDGLFETVSDTEQAVSTTVTTTATAPEVEKPAPVAGTGKVDFSFRRRNPQYVYPENAELSQMNTEGRRASSGQMAVMSEHLTKGTWQPFAIIRQPPAPGAAPSIATHFSHHQGSSRQPWAAPQLSQLAIPHVPRPDALLPSVSPPGPPNPYQQMGYAHQTPPPLCQTVDSPEFVTQHPLEDHFQTTDPSQSTFSPQSGSPLQFAAPPHLIGLPPSVFRPRITPTAQLVSPPQPGAPRQLAPRLPSIKYNDLSWSRRTWICHECSNINLFFGQDVSQDTQDFNICEFPECQHPRDFFCTTLNEEPQAAASLFRVDLGPFSISQGRYQCAFHQVLRCDQIYPSWTSAMRCTDNHFTGNALIPCIVPGCPCYFTQRHELNEHLGQHYAPIQIHPSFCPFKILGCPAVANCPADMAAHFTVHVQAVADFEAYRGAEYPLPKAIRGSVPGFSCPYVKVFKCRVHFAIEEVLRSHIKEHFKSVLRCPYCAATEVCISDFATHLVGHTHN